MRSAPFRPLLSFFFVGILVTCAASTAHSTSFSQACFDTVGSPGLATGDFNGDGHVDLAVSPGGNAGPGFFVTPYINIYLGNGLGGFTFSNQVTTSVEFIFLAAADVNNDGKLDLVNSGDYTGTPSINLGNGDGTFQAAQILAASGVDGLALADLNNDGYVDLITGEDKTMKVQFNLGNGTFGAPTVYKIGTYARAFTTADLNGDGLRDVLELTIANPNKSVVVVLLNQRGGSLGMRSKTTLSTVYPGRHVQTADFNGDGKLDVATTHLLGGGVTVALGDGTGGFGSPAHYPMPGGTNHLGIGDLNGDGKLDIAAASSATNGSGP